VPFTEDRLAEAMVIYNHYVTGSTATFQITPANRDGMRDIIMQPGPHHAAWAIVESDRLIGYLVVGRHKAREAFCLTAEVGIYLSPDCTGRGIGRKAMAVAEEHGRTVGLHVLVASITGTNARSLALAEACGWEKCAHYRQVGRKFDEWLDVVCYQKILD
jgi:phosphinothricin acetyltransferase